MPLREQRRPRECKGSWEGQEVAEKGTFCVPVALSRGTGPDGKHPGVRSHGRRAQRILCLLLQTSLIFKH
ncbi:hypothetical protein PBY51_016849 [Eleginops maclovinus]|uniref:Uncharacterized protein n=1 Tax=Eleginops maclovinus TaxID=56733 RepID=A0AAN7WUS0_ELEMC|nr:hypothetical protein PBY51_016849 [Eleginops maclovinus]